MQKKSIAVVGITLVAVGLVGIVLTLLFMGPNTGFTPPVGMMGGNMDAMFIEQMIPHHDDAIAMAELALVRAEHPEIEQLAEDIKRNQTAENVQMREWYSDWFASDVPDSGGESGFMGSMMGDGMVDLEDLENAEPFDKMFIEQMIPHHQMALMMSQMAGGASDRPEMRDFTDSIIEAQSAEIESMQDWYAEWYGN